MSENQLIAMHIALGRLWLPMTRIVRGQILS